MQFHVKFFLTKNEFTTTIKHPDMYDFKKVCAKIMFEFPRELADGTVGQSDFRDLMERHIMIWSDKAYIVKEPVRYIGLQVLNNLSKSSINSTWSLIDWLLKMSQVFLRHPLDILFWK